MADRTIFIRRSLFGGRYSVVVEPRTIDRPSQEFLNHGRAFDAATRLSEETRWTVVDQTDGGEYE